MRQRTTTIWLSAIAAYALFAVQYTQAGYTTIDKPGASGTWLNGIDGEIVVGNYSGANGFIYDLSTSAWTNFALEQGGTSYNTTPYSISDGYIVGHYAAGGRPYIGFLYNMATSGWITLDFGHPNETIAFDIDGGKVVGNYGTSALYTGFVYEIGTGNWQTLDFPGSRLTYLTGIDMDAGAGGTIVASGHPIGSDIDEAWLYDIANSTWTRFYGPHGETEVFLYSIDDNYITGIYGASQQAFLYDAAAHTWTLLNVPGAVGTSPPHDVSGNKVVGYYNAPGSPGHGFLYDVPAVIPAPAAVVLAGIGVSLVNWLRRRRMV